MPFVQECNSNIATNVRCQVDAVFYQIFSLTVGEFFRRVNLPTGSFIFLSTTSLNIVEKYWYSKELPLNLSTSTSEALSCWKSFQIMSAIPSWPLPQLSYSAAGFEWRSLVDCLNDMNSYTNNLCFSEVAIFLKVHCLNLLDLPYLQISAPLIPWCLAFARFISIFIFNSSAAGSWSFSLLHIGSFCY